MGKTSIWENVLENKTLVRIKTEMFCQTFLQCKIEVLENTHANPLGFEFFIVYSVKTL